MAAMTTVKIFLTVVLALPFCLALQAQPMQPLAPGQIGLSFSSTATATGDGKLKDDSTTYKDIGIYNYSSSLNQRIGLGQGRNLTIGVDYDVTDIERKDDAKFPLPGTLQSLGASAKYFQPVDQQWMMSASIGASSQVTNTGLLSDGWGMRTSVVGIYNRSRQLTLLFGLAYNSLSQDLKFVPILGCDWRPNEKWSFAFGFPKTGATYKLNKQLALGLAVSGSGGAYYVKNDPLPGAAPHSLDDSRLQYMEARLGFHGDWKINDTFRVSGTVGQVLYRQFKYIDRDYKLKSRDTVPFLSLAGTVSL
jgi:hypothetical protein